MRAAEFYGHFERGFVVACLPAGLHRLKGAQPKWKAAVPSGVVTFKFSTNSRIGGLLPLLWPGEFRPLFVWRHKSGGEKLEDMVSFFQYTDPPMVREAVELQRVALDKYLRSRFSEPAERTDWVERIGALDEPKPNVERWFYYFDDADAESWGRYFGGFMAAWLARFNESPESMEGWCRRVLWQDGAGRQ